MESKENDNENIISVKTVAFPISLTKTMDKNPLELTALMNRDS